jgi:hypothetical protein
MNYLADYKKMVENKIIDYTKLGEYGVNEVFNNAYKVIEKLQELDKNHHQLFVEMLKLMTEISNHKAALEMKIGAVTINDSKNEETSSQYVAARGAVTVSKGKRLWFSHYLGNINDYINEKGKIDLHLVRRNGRLDVVKKAIDKLNSENE